MFEVPYIYRFSVPWFWWCLLRFDTLGEFKKAVLILLTFLLWFPLWKFYDCWEGSCSPFISKQKARKKTTFILGMAWDVRDMSSKWKLRFCFQRAKKIVSYIVHIFISLSQNIRKLVAFVHIRSFRVLDKSMNLCITIVPNLTKKCAKIRKHNNILWTH